MDGFILQHWVGNAVTSKRARSTSGKVEWQLWSVKGLTDLLWVVVVGTAHPAVESTPIQEKHHEAGIC